ncbi:MAG: isopentenyl-diphosphate Delta-isomerase [Tessaracoccus sp.]
MNDLIVLLDQAGRPSGTADRLAIHTGDTPYHLAFSSYLFNADGMVLLTRRALGKKTWAGVWTNSCCGHPRPGEDLHDAVVRRVTEELGHAPEGLRLMLDSFSYRATDAGGIVENELCPVWVGTYHPHLLAPDPQEVMGTAWVPWHTVVDIVAEAPELLSPWAVRQVPLLDAKLKENR